MPEHGQVLAHLHIDLPDHRDYRGESYLPVFERVVRSFGQWFVQEVSTASAVEIPPSPLSPLLSSVPPPTYLFVS